MTRVLVVDDEESIRETLSEFLIDEGYELRTSPDALQAIDCLDEFAPEIVVTDIILPKMTGIELMRELGRRVPDAKIIVITGEPALETAIEAVRSGAFDYLAKPVTQHSICKVVNAAAHVARLERENRSYASQLEEIVTLRTKQVAQASSRLRASENRYRSLAENSPTGIFVEQDGHIVFTNPRFDELIEGNLNEQTSILDLVAEEMRDPLVADLSRKEFGSTPSPRHEVQLITRTGSRRWFEVLLSKIKHNDQTAIMGHLIDISQRKQWEAERRDLEEQLRQFQKMEAIGRLAGGVAHDFNNMLTGILGYASLILTDLEPETNLHDDVLQIQQTAERASALTAQLLAFSRKQIIAPKVIEPASRIEEAVKMLKRILADDVDLAIEPAEERWNIRVDPSQFDQVLINLATNARDAMLSGGRVLLSTHNCKPDTLPFIEAKERGSAFVEVRCTDSGCGMDEETRAQVFEPFFSTKEQGKGTGLGLSTVYGIVRQNEGFIKVESLPEEGSTFRVFFPKVEQQLDHIEATSVDSVYPRGSEAILLVEDESVVRALARRTLTQHGYTVVDAESGQAALELTHSRSSAFDLLVTDVVMPHMNGVTLAETLRKDSPALPVLFISGYSQDIITNYGGLSDNASYLQKPFTVQTLTAAVRKLLDRAS